MKRPDLFFAALLVPLDYGVLMLAAWTAYTLRFRLVTDILPVVAPVPLHDLLASAAVVALGWIVILAAVGAYHVRSQRLSTELGRIFVGASVAVLLVIVFIFFRREFFPSRFIILASWVVAVGYLWLTHISVRLVQRLLLRRGVGIRRAILFGQNAASEEIHARLHDHPQHGLKIIHSWPEITPATLAEFDAYSTSHHCDLIIQADPDAPKEQILALRERCTLHGLDFQYVPDAFDADISRLESGQIAGVPVLMIRRTSLDGWGRISKRLTDMIGAVLGLIIFIIPGVVIAALIKIDSAGPVFVRLERVGQGQRRFWLWKFRSMVRDAHAMKDQLRDRNERADGPLFKMSNDPRITRLGRWLRTTSIDEIPQLWNVLRGEMSLVGPRPHEPEEVARYDVHHKKLLTIRPGVTGLAQVSGRSHLNFEDEARLDTHYIEHWSLGLDVSIIWKTPLVVFSRKNVA